MSQPLKTVTSLPKSWRWKLLNLTAKAGWWYIGEPFSGSSSSGKWIYSSVREIPFTGGRLAFKKAFRRDDTLFLDRWRPNAIEAIINHPHMRLEVQWYKYGENLLIFSMSVNTWKQWEEAQVLEPGEKSNAMVMVMSRVDGSLIGDPEEAFWLMRHNIQSPQNGDRDNKKSSSVGMLVDKTGVWKAWVGWSHRASQSFKLGDKVFDRSFVSDDTMFNQCGSVTISNSQQAKQAAINFADFVGH